MINMKTVRSLRVLDLHAKLLCRTIATAELKKTPLHELNDAKGAQFVPFANYYMPQVYKGQTSIESHIWTRSKATLFDVSHMAQWTVEGTDAVPFLHWVSTANANGLKLNKAAISFLPNETGGIVDDLMILRNSEESFTLITNAACREKDEAHLRKQGAQFANLKFRAIEDKGLIALQGPESMNVLGKVVSADLKELKFLHSITCNYMSTDLTIVRSGYTGEDGFEISADSKVLEPFVSNLLDANQDVLRLGGLSARDSLRLEAGMTLYGNDIDEHTSAVEAGLLKSIKKFHTPPGIIGMSEMQKVINNGVSKVRTGIIMDKGFARAKCTVMSVGGKKIGQVTSGAFSPILKTSIAMAYIDLPFAESETPVNVEIRGKLYPGKIRSLPFIPNRFYR